MNPVFALIAIYIAIFLILAAVLPPGVKEVFMVMFVLLSVGIFVFIKDVLLE
jgi:hypothetical protein